MGFMRKQMLLQQRASFERTLQERMSYLSGKGVVAPKTEKDTLVKQLKADIKAVNKRLRTVAEHDKRTEEMARTKAEKAAAPPKEQGGGKGEKPKKAAEEGKGKKAKPEGGKGQKAPGPAKEGKSEIKKSVEQAGEGPAGQAKTAPKS